MDNRTAEIIGRKAKALKHVTQLIKKIDRVGHVDIKLNCTGATIPCDKEDATYLTLVASKAALAAEIASIEVVNAASLTAPVRRLVPAPSGAAPTAEEILAEQRRKRAEYQHRWYAKMKARKAKENS